MGIVLVLNDIVKKGSGDNPNFTGFEIYEDSIFSLLQRSPSTDQTSFKMEDRASVPLVFVSPVKGMMSLKRLFSNNDYFGFDINKVWFLEEEKLPVVNSAAEEENRHKILVKSPWKTLQSPVGSGGIFRSLSSHNIPEIFNEKGVQYIEVCKFSEDHVLGNAPFLGYVNLTEADVGIQIFEDAKDSEESFDMTLSINFIKLLTKEIDKIQFCAIPQSNSYVKMVDTKWIDVTASSPNSYQFHC